MKKKWLVAEDAVQQSKDEATIQVILFVFSDRLCELSFLLYATLLWNWWLLYLLQIAIDAKLCHTTNMAA